MDMKNLLLKGLRRVYRKMYFKVNNWCNLTIEEILLHKMFFYQVKSSVQENMINSLIPYCKCSHTLTNNKIFKKRKMCVMHVFAIRTG